MVTTAEEQAPLASAVMVLTKVAMLPGSQTIPAG